MEFLNLKSDVDRNADNKLKNVHSLVMVEKSSLLKRCKVWTSTSNYRCKERLRNVNKVFMHFNFYIHE